MPRRRTRTLTEVELEFMQVIWGAGEVTTEDVMEALGAQGRDLSDGSVRKMLSILLTKGYLTRRRQGRSFLYKPTVEKAQATRRMAVDLLKRAFGGRAALMVAALMESSDVRSEDIAEIRQLIDEQKQEEAK